MNSQLQFIQLFERHKRLILIVPCVCILVGILTILFFPRKYRSESKLFLQVGRESVGIDPTATTGQMIHLQQNGREDEVNSAMELLRSRGISEKVIESLGPDIVLDSDPDSSGGIIGNSVGALLGAVTTLDPISEREQAIIEFENSLDVSADRKSAVIVITYTAKSPQLAQKILRELIEVYPQEYLRIHRNRQSHQFFADQQELLRKQLDEAAAKLRDAKNQMGIASIEGGRSTLEQQLHEITIERLRSEQEVATAKARIKDLTQQLDRIPEKQVAELRRIPNQGADMLRNQLYSLQVQQQDLLARYNEVHPLVMAISAQVEEAEKLVTDQVEMREETTQQINPIYHQLSLELKQENSRLAGLKSRLESLAAQNRSILAELKKLNEFEVQLDELEREEELRRGKYMQYAENLEQARIDQQLAEERISNVSIAQDPTLSEKPVSPHKSLVALASVMLAVAGTASLVIAKKRFRQPEGHQAQTVLPNNVSLNGRNGDSHWNYRESHSR